MVELFYQQKSIIMQHSMHDKLSVGDEINSQRFVCLWCEWKKGIDHLQFQQVREWKKYSNYTRQREEVDVGKIKIQLYLPREILLLLVQPCLCVPSQDHTAE